jgi:protein-S-isoprenylcysteine O-methyltransferase Ste14
MSPWIAKAIILAGSVVMIAIRHPHEKRSHDIKVVKTRKGTIEIVLLTVVGISFLLPFVWIVTPVLAFADYSLRSIPLIIGVTFIALGLWLFYRSHADLGVNWSTTLEVREKHQLVTQGVYRQIRHPMYLAFLLHAGGQALVLPNWVAGPSYLVAFTLLFALRLGPEERMMREEFGKDYEEYSARTKRLIPRLW